MLTTAGLAAEVARRAAEDEMAEERLRMNIPIIAQVRDIFAIY
ncbi:hypothetical protein J2Z19_001867 [Ensifer adhaerens]|uniref:Uncharacterized protein n=1 Tax=Ensifer adhaerens TaxID=106592 RepID=A0ACC5STK4_ENSAD|nr:hypothetical protein [Ensifer adhaerens]MBP1872155.1 hypothetical protein [Ensifer adhaerens]